MTTSRIASIVAMPLLGLGLGLAPAAAADLGQPAQQPVAIASSTGASSRALDDADYSKPGLLGAGSSFLALGMATAVVAHRRRWPSTPDKPR